MWEVGSTSDYKGDYQTGSCESQILGHTLLTSATGTKAAGSSEYRKVVDKCIGGATSETTFSTSSACKDCVEVPTLCDMVKLCSQNSMHRKIVGGVIIQPSEDEDEDEGKKGGAIT